MQNTTSIPAMQQDGIFIFVTGPPASGKTTLSRELSQKLDCYHLDVKAYLHDLATGTGHPVGAYCGGSAQQVASLIPRRHKYGDFMVRSILKWKIVSERHRLRLANKRKILVIDGFPTSTQELAAFMNNIGVPRHIVALHADEDILRARFTSDGGQVADFDMRFSFFTQVTQPCLAQWITDPRFCQISADSDLQVAKEKALQRIGQAWVEDVEDDGQLVAPSGNQYHWRGPVRKDSAGPEM